MSHTDAMSYQGDHGEASYAAPNLITAADAKAHYDTWRAAHEALQFASSYSIGDRSLTRQDGAEVRYWMGYWAREYKQLRAREQGSAGSGYRVADFRYGPV